MGILGSLRLVTKDGTTLGYACSPRCGGMARALLAREREIPQEDITLVSLKEKAGELKVSYSPKPECFISH